MIHSSSIEINMGAVIYEIWMDQYIKKQDENIRERLNALGKILNSCRIETGGKCSESENYCIHEINRAIKNLRNSLGFKNSLGA